MKNFTGIDVAKGSVRQWTLTGMLMLLCFSGRTAYPQSTKLLDRIAGVVGNAIILDSDIEQMYASALMQGASLQPDAKCVLFESLLTQKLLAKQASMDSVQVQEEELNNELDMRLRYITKVLGGQEQAEQFLHKSLIQYKEEMRPLIKEQLITRKMQQKIIEKVQVTPQEVESYFRSLPSDHQQYANKAVEIGEIVLEPKLTYEEKQFYKEKAEQLHQRVKNGEDFATLARLYSQDPGSALEGGNLPFSDRLTFAKEFAAMAFKLKVGMLSPVFETKFGFHFLEVLERRGEQVRVRHILIQPQPTPASMNRAKARAEQTYAQLLDKSLDFSQAASLYSDSPTKYYGGLLRNDEGQNLPTTLIPVDKLDPQMAFAIDSMAVGSISKPLLFSGNNGQKQYKILFLKSKVDAHRENLVQDFAKIKQAAKADKINRTMQAWLEKRKKETYISIHPAYAHCAVLKSWIQTANNANNP